MKCAVVVPAFNASRYLRETLLSLTDVRCISQIIVVDDGSTDDTSAVAETLRAELPTLEIIRQNNAGLAAARNAGLAAVGTETVCFLDADDCLIPEGLDTLLTVLSMSPHAVAAFGMVSYIDANSRALAVRTKRWAFTKPLETEDVLQGNFIDTAGAILFRTAAVRAAGCFDPLVTFAEDWEFYTRVSLLGTIVPTRQLVVKYRQHDDSMMHRKQLSLATFETALEKVFSSTGPFACRLPRAKLRQLELRSRAGILRRLGQRSQSLASHMNNLLRLMSLAAVSKGDPFIVALLSRAILTTGKRLLLR